MSDYSPPSPFRLEIFDRLDSANDAARDASDQGAPEWTVILAKSQAKGRGRMGRVWDSPEGNLYCSILIDVAAQKERAAEMSFVAALAVFDALKLAAPALAFSLKWPNDILCAGAKISGMLLERTERHLILGVGINVESAPELALYPAASLRGSKIESSPGSLLGFLCPALLKWTIVWRNSGFHIIREKWLERAAGVSGPVRLKQRDGSSVSGVFYGLDAGGALLLDTPSGERRVILAGDVFFDGNQ